MPRVRLHPPVGNAGKLFMKVWRKSSEIAARQGSLPKQLDSYWGENVALLKSGDAPRYFIVHGCLALVGFEKKRARASGARGSLRTSLVHLQSWAGVMNEKLARECVRRALRHSGKGAVFAVAGLSKEEGARRKLLAIVRNELESHGALLSERNVVQNFERDAPTGIVVDARKQVLHVFRVAEAGK